MDVAIVYKSENWRDQLFSVIEHFERHCFQDTWQATSEHLFARPCQRKKEEFTSPDLIMRSDVHLLHFGTC